jgi:hypothetical protein
MVRVSKATPYILSNSKLFRQVVRQLVLRAKRSRYCRLSGVEAGNLPIQPPQRSIQYRRETYPADIRHQQEACGFIQSIECANVPKNQCPKYQYFNQRYAGLLETEKQKRPKHVECQLGIIGHGSAHARLNPDSRMRDTHKHKQRRPGRTEQPFWRIEKRFLKFIVPVTHLIHGEKCGNTSQD